MATVTTDTTDRTNKTSAVDHAADACRHAAHLSHQGRLLGSLAADAVEDAAYAVKRSITLAKRRVEQLEDVKDETLHRVRRQPLRALALALGSGLVIGLVVGWVGRRPERRA